MAIDLSLARGVARRSFSDWETAGRNLEAGITSLLRQTQVQILRGRPPTRVINGATEKLGNLLERSGLPGTIHQSSGRRQEATICLPEAVDDRICFIALHCLMNGRTGLINLQRNCVLSASQHVLQRLHQRLGTTVPSVALQEVYSCIEMAPTMVEAAHAVAAQHWPLLTKNGIFVCAPSENREKTTLITWMRLDQLGKKWGRVADDLRAAKLAASNNLSDKAFSIEFLRLHSWLLRPHAPGPDIETMWWSSKPSADQDDATREIEESLTDQSREYPQRRGDHFEHRDPEKTALTGDSSTEWHAAISHQVKLRERYDGIVLQVRGNGERTIALGNGFFGLLKDHDLKGENTEIPQSSASVGTRVNVEVTRVIGERYTSYRSIELQLTEVANIIWARAQRRYLPGFPVAGEIIWRGAGGALVSIEPGTLGWLPGSELSFLPGDEFREDGPSLGAHVELMDSGYDEASRRLLLTSLQSWDIITARHPIGAIVNGTIVWRRKGVCAIRIMDGTTGWMNDKEFSWSRHAPCIDDVLCVGQSMEFRVIGHNLKRRNLNLSRRQVTENPVAQLDESSFPGTTHIGTVINLVDYGAFVSLPIGVDGLLHKTSCPPNRIIQKGELIRVRVESIDKERNRISLSYSD